MKSYFDQINRSNDIHGILQKVWMDDFISFLFNEERVVVKAITDKFGSFPFLFMSENIKSIFETQYFSWKKFPSGQEVNQRKT